MTRFTVDDQFHHSTGGQTLQYLPGVLTTKTRRLRHKRAFEATAISKREPLSDLQRLDVILTETPNLIMPDEKFTIDTPDETNSFDLCSRISSQANTCSDTKCKNLGITGLRKSIREMEHECPPSQLLCSNRRMCDPRPSWLLAFHFSLCLLGVPNSSLKAFFFPNCTYDFSL
eukprot:Gb_03635 [translate_table: standard]